METHDQLPPLRFSREELLRDHLFDRPHVVEGKRLHGGFINGVYQSPRALVRSCALRSWTNSLLDRGGQPLNADSGLLAGARIPNARQQMVLVANGLDQIFWNSLTVIGKIEARGRLLAEMRFPDLRPWIVEDISEMAIGHLDRGLMLAHGLDEGGVPEEEIGGHDQMWFVARDLAFGPDAHPDAEPPENIGRPVSEDKVPLGIPTEIEGLVSFLANLLIIEFRAELGFAETQDVLRNPSLFRTRRPQAQLAAEIVERIRTDELIHVESLRLYLGEFRSVTFRTTDGGTLPGSYLIDSFWSDLVRWASVEQPPLVAESQRRAIRERIAHHRESERIMREFDEAA